MKKKKKVTITPKQVKKAHDMILKNVRTHCRQLYPKGKQQEVCNAVAIISSAEIADVFEEVFGIKI